MSTKDYLEKDYYKTLGVPKTAKTADIKKAYRDLARKYHPDANANKGNADAGERFKEITEAYNVLSDEKQRKEYDEARSMFGGGFRVPTGTRGGAAGGSTFDLGDLFGGDGLGDVLGGIFRGRGGTAQSRARRGADVETETTLPFGDSIDGATVALRLTGEGPCPVCHGTGAKAGTVPRVCPDCQGTGQQSRNLGGFGMSEPCKTCRGRGLVVDDPCQSCSGSGRAMSSRTIQARIPAGVADGQRIRIPGKGAPGEHGGRNGDLYVRVHVKPHPVFGRNGDNLTVAVPVTISELALGAEIKVPTHRGPAVTVRVPPGTPNGQVFRVPGRGVRKKDGTLGALLATVDITVPQDLNSKARSALEDLRIATSGTDPREELLKRAKQN
ncbi:MAG: molecular chaperone DnaJ [Trebonia sp.]|jgi:molecular chaperone DnaJ|uniref:molecular chaperone DnaJ n=2 Tax=Trebonia sp. TaxID=2767075 RepID=UPI002B8F4A19|nr:molecular chaperone DnaJ [Trebonia sp.]